MPSNDLRIAIAIGICVLTSPASSLADPGSELPAKTPPNSTGASAPAPRAGSWVHIDPATGKPGPRPAGVAAVPPDPAFSTSHQGLVERPSPGGGMMIDLQGRFRSAATAAVGTDGTVHRDCVAPGTTGRKE